jgi:hypothetical protein
VLEVEMSGITNADAAGVKLLCCMPGGGIIEAAFEESRERILGVTGAAVKLGIPRSTLESKIKRLRIDKYRFRTEEREVRL